MGWSIPSLLISTTCVLGTLEVATAKGCKDFVWYFSSGFSRKFPSVLLPWPVEPIKRMIFAPRRCRSSDMVSSLWYWKKKQPLQLTMMGDKVSLSETKSSSKVTVSQEPQFRTKIASRTSGGSTWQALLGSFGSHNKEWGGGGSCCV